MTRKAHVLRSIQSASFPHDLVAFDTETLARALDEETVEHDLVFGMAARTEWAASNHWTKPEWVRFTTAKEFWLWLESCCRSKRAIWAYCHNANFDWQVLRMTALLPELGWVCEQAIIEDPPNYFVWRKGDKRLKLLDSTNYWKRSLADIGKRVGLEKLVLPDSWDDTARGDAYCRRDVEILLLALQRWIEWLKEHELGGLGISLAQQAWRAYCHRFLDHKIYIDTSEEALTLTRASYYGGRTEAWTVGTFVHDVQCVDVNSMYPAVMQSRVFPTKLHGVYKRVKHAELERWLGKYCVTAEVTIDTDEPIYPERTPDALCFPVGRFRTILSTPELSYALEHSHIEQCHALALYDRAQIFERYVAELYELRLQFMRAGDEAGVFFVKIMLNSLYGKFGQRGGYFETMYRTEDMSLRTWNEIDLVTRKRYRWRQIAGLVMQRQETGESRYSFPAVAAHVTAEARMVLWELARDAGFENVHYMDTDSLHVTQAGYKRLSHHLDPETLGALKLEKSIDTAIYYGPKDYELDGVRKIKGVSKSATELDVGYYSQNQWVSMRGAMSIDHSGGPIVRRVSKRFSRHYRKGTVGPTNRVSPLRRVLDLLRPDGDS